MQQHAYVIEGGVEEGIERAEALIKSELGMEAGANPDVVVLRYGLLSAEDARGIASVASSAPVQGAHKAIIIAAGRAYHEAQNALLKIFEEPPVGTYLFLVVPSLGGLLPTLRSRVQILEAEYKGASIKYKGNADGVPEVAKEFMKMSVEKRTAYIAKLAKGKDEEERRAHRDEAIALMNGLEQAAYAKGVEKYAAFLAELGQLRSYLYDRAAPMKMILEHVSLVLPASMKG